MIIRNPETFTFIVMAIILFGIIMLLVGYLFVGICEKMKGDRENTPIEKKAVKKTGLSRLTIKSVIRWEQMRGKSFSLMDYSDREDMEALLYAMSIDCFKVPYKYEVFKLVLANEKVMDEMSVSLGRIISAMAQFRHSSVDAGSGGNDNDSPETIGNIVATLIMSGLDAHYALNEMELQDLPLYIEAYENKRKDEMESARLWTYLTILPHIDAKVMENGAKDLITFPWEQNSGEETGINDAEVERFEEFLKKGKRLWLEN